MGEVNLQIKILIPDIRKKVLVTVEMLLYRRPVKLIHPFVIQTMKPFDWWSWCVLVRESKLDISCIHTVITLRIRHDRLCWNSCVLQLSLQSLHFRVSDLDWERRCAECHLLASSDTYVILQGTQICVTFSQSNDLLDIDPPKACLEVCCKRSYRFSCRGSTFCLDCRSIPHQTLFLCGPVSWSALSLNWWEN